MDDLVARFCSPQLTLARSELDIVDGFSAEARCC